MPGRRGAVSGRTTQDTVPTTNSIGVVKFLGPLKHSPRLCFTTGHPHPPMRRHITCGYKASLSNLSTIKKRITPFDYRT